MIKKNLLALLLAIVPILTFAQETSIDEKIEAKFRPFATAVSEIVFYAIPIADKQVPIVLIILLLGALFFTLYFNLYIYI